MADRTHRAEEAIRASAVIIGYGPYLERIADLLPGKEIFQNGMTRERERVREAVLRAAAGASVALVSSGDSGIYGMAGLAIECLEKENLLGTIPLEIVPGITAASSAGARLGAPLMLDYATISLSDRLVPLEQIEKRLRAALAGGFVIALYNPKSVSRTEPFRRACEIMAEYLPPQTPVGICTSMGLCDERSVLMTLAELPHANVEMTSTVIVGNASTRNVADLMLTPRGYYTDNAASE